MFDKQLNELKAHFAITNPEDWQQVAPMQLRARSNVGPVFVDYLRLHLANRGLTLLDDKTPAYWQSYLSVKRGGMQISKTDTAKVMDFTILVDTGEQQPFTFQGFIGDADTNNAPMIVPTERRPLGTSKGDYSVKEMEGLVHVERKSCNDAISTIFGFGQHRDNFIKTLEFLAEITSSAVVIECDRDAMLDACVPRGKRSKNQMTRTINRQIMAWEDDYRVPWIFNRTRRIAEYRTFLWLHRAWRHQIQSEKQAQKESQ